MNVCRTCLSSKGQLIELEHSVQYLEQQEKLCYNDLLQYCCISSNAIGFMETSPTNWPKHICLRCSKALEVSYHFLKMVRHTDDTLLAQQATKLKPNCEITLDKHSSKNMVELQESEADKLFQEEHCDLVDFDPETASDLMNTDLMNFNNPNYLNSNSNSEKSTTATTDDAFKVLRKENEPLFIHRDFEYICKRVQTPTIPKEPTTVTTNIASNIVIKKKNIVKPIIMVEKPNIQTTKRTINSYYADFKQFVKTQTKKLEYTVNTETSYNIKKLKLSNTDDVESISTLTATSEADTESLDARKENLICKVCSKCFYDQMSYDRHQYRHTGIVPFRCHYCNYFTSYTESLRKHYLNQHSVEASTEMLYSRTSPEQTANEYKFQEMTFQCKECDTITHEYKDICEHISNEHDVTDDLESAFIAWYNCSKCSRNFRELRGMRIHYKRAHFDKLNQNSNEPKTDELYQCEQCGKEFTLKTSMCTHKRHCENAGRTLHCQLCNTNYVTVRQYELHLSSEHSVEMIHECELCGKTFRNAHALSLHRKRHTERNFQCDQCPKNYINNNELQVHIDRIHNTETQALCRVCDTTFATALALRTHENREHFKQQHSCEYCGHQCSTPTSLKLHQYLHTGMPYRCEYCDKSFGLRRFMREHALSAHDIKLSDRQLGDMFFKNMGYPSRYDVFSPVKTTTTTTTKQLLEANEDDIEGEMLQFGLRFDDIVRELFDGGTDCDEFLNTF